MTKLKVLVLMGGRSAERAISLSTGREILAALNPDKYIVTGYDIQASDSLSAPHSGYQPPPLQDNPQAMNLVPVTTAGLAACGYSERPDVVVIALHGPGGEDGTIQGLLELVGLPYTGSGVLASALAMDKSMTKRVLAAEGIAVPREVVVAAAGGRGVALRQACELGFPLIIKPNSQGSTVGCTIVEDGNGLDDAISLALTHADVALIEELVRGTEITVSLLGNENPEPLPIIEIETAGGFYDYAAKYEPGGSRHIIPARISAGAAARATGIAVRCHQILGCRGMSRVDMIVMGDEPVVLEVNTIPGMTPTSLLPEAARAAGIPFSNVLDRLIALALER